MKFLKKLWQCFFAWNVVVSSETKLDKADVIVAFSFGDGESSGKSNRELADIVLRLHRQLDIAVLAQKEVYNALPTDITNMKKPFVAEITPLVDYMSFTPKYPDTRGVYMGANYFLNELRFTKPYGFRFHPIFVVHPAHMWRIQQMARLDPLFEEFYIADTSSVSYDRRSFQWRTRRKINFVLWEIPTRIYFLLRKWI